MTTLNITRRELLQKAAIAGFALAVYPLAASAITTDLTGIVDADVLVNTSNGKIPAYQAMPKGNGPFPVLIIAHEIFGVHEFIRNVCRRFAKLGFYAIAPNLFYRQGDVTQFKDFKDILKIVNQASTEQVMSDLDATVKFAEESKKGNLAHLNMTGFCWGGRTTWLYASHNSKLKSAISWYGPLVGTDPLHPQAPVDIASTLKVPVLGLYGGLDSHISDENRKQMEENLKKGTSGSKIMVYAKAEHGFFADYRPSYNKEAADDGLKQLLAWIKEHGGN